MADDKDQETEKRRDEIARRMLKTPPKPHKRKKDEDASESEDDQGKEK